MEKIYIYSILSILGLSAIILSTYKYKLNKLKNNNKKINDDSIVNTSNAEYTYDKLKDDLVQLNKRYFRYITVNILNKTSDNRNIYEIILGNKNAKKHFLIHGGIHGCEYLNCLIIMKILEDYLKKFKYGSYKGVRYTKLFNNVALHIIPMVNPDGIMISECGIDSIRNLNLRNNIITCFENDVKAGYTKDKFDEYLKKWKANANGVDLNRNFNADWEKINQRDKCSCKNYKGKKYESEIETQTLIELSNKYNFIGTISYHSSGNLIYWDYSKSRVKKECDYMADIASLITGYEKAESDNNYEEVVSGGYKDWASYKRCPPIPSITLEVGEKECPLDISEFKKAYYSNEKLWLEYAYLFND